MRGKAFVIALVAAGLVAAAPAQANTDVMISTAADSNVAFAGGVYTFTDATANINNTGLATNLTNGNVTIQAANGQGGNGMVVINAPVSWASGFSLAVNTGSPGGVNQAPGGPITTDGTVTVNSDAFVLLAAAGNDFATLSATADGLISIADANAITLGPVASTNDLMVTAGGSITQCSAATVTQNTTLNSGNNSITLGFANDFGGPVSFSGSDVTLTDANALSLGSSTATGNLALTAGGAITQTAGLTAGSATTVNGGANVSLPNGANDFTGSVSVNSTANTTLADANALTLGTSMVTGLLHLLAGQGGGANSHVTQTPASTLTVNGPTTVEVGGPNASSDVVLDRANALNGVIGIAGGTKVRDLKLRSTSAGASLNGLPPAPRDVAITFDNAPVQLAGSSVSGTMSVQAGGPITQTGSGLDVVLGASFGAGPNPITLTNPLNDFGFPVTLNNSGATDAQIADENDLDLATGSIGRNLTATAGNRIIVQPAAAIGAGGAGTFVTDNNAATAPAIGSGGVTLGAGASIDPVGPLAIYTARRSQNSIAANAMLNGATFTPGTEFVDTATEVWNTRFPSGTAQIPFTIFYKDNETTPPQTTIDSGPANGSTISERTPTFTFSADEPNSTFECAVDAEAFAPCTSPRMLAALGDGVHNFTVRATDTLGNVDPSPAQRSFTVDTSAPDTALTKTPKRKIKTRKKKVRVVFEFASSQPGATFECSLDGVAYVPCTSPKSYKVGKGEHFFLLRSGDAAGNKDSTPARFDFKVKRKKRRHR